MRGTELRNLRQKLGLTLEQLAKELYHPTTLRSVGTSTVSRWERSTMVTVLPSWVDLAASAMEARIKRAAGIKPKPLEKHLVGSKIFRDGVWLVWTGTRWLTQEAWDAEG